jgi:nucleolar protein TMA23
MNAHALLTSQGWRGTGHSLHPTSDTTGLSRPLLVSQKTNNLGIGKKQHRTSDMWWMNAFDKSLKGLDTTQEGKVVQNLTNGGLDMVAKGGARFVGNGGGLYASFVRGECLSGTITPEEERAGEEVVKKRKNGEDMSETKEERRARKAVKRLRREQKSIYEEESVEEKVEEKGTEAETKDERRERKRQKKLRKEAERNEEAASEIAKKKKRRKG